MRAMRAPACFAAATILAAPMAQSAPDPVAVYRSTVESVVVTATRRSEDVDKVAASVGVLTLIDMETRGVRSFADAARYLPGVTFDPASNGISIRGINSGAGAGTTGIYLDEAPIQIRSLDYGSNNTLPAVFDLNRIEVLRGPQGTLFGAGSEGGAVRYITAQPNRNAYEAYGRGEVSIGRNGSINHEAGAAVSGPLTDELAFRISAWHRHDGGTIDKIDGETGTTTRSNANTADTTVVHTILTWAPIPRLTITPGDFYQDRVKHDTDSYWVGASDPAKGIYRSGTPERMNDADHFNLASLKLAYAFDGADLISNSSYFTRLQRVHSYSGTIYNLSYFQQLLAAGTDPLGNPCTAGRCAAGLYPLLTPDAVNLPGFGPYQSSAIVTNRQTNLVQEVRLQSSEPGARIVWIAGAFFALNRQHSIDTVFDQQLAGITQYLWGRSLTDAWGGELLPNDVGYINSTVAHDQQIAVFLNAAYALTEEWKVQGGVRFARTRFDFRNASDGPENFGSGGGTGKQSENPMTWMGSVAYPPTDTDILYASVANGYRIGGANQPFPESSCRADLDALGLDSVPKSYNSDRVTSYELGSKNRMLGGRLQLQTSVYRSNWNRMQQANYLSSCGFQYVANFGSATSTGFDLDADWIVTDGLELHAEAGYMDAHFTADSRSGPAPTAPILARRGDSLPGSPWTFSIDASYGFQIAGQPISARADYSVASHNSRLTPQTDSFTTQFDPGAVNDPATNIVAIRFETSVREALVSLFVDNLLDSRPQLGLTHQDRYTALYEAWTLRPRTIGLSVTYHY